MTVNYKRYNKKNKVTNSIKIVKIKIRGQVCGTV